MSEKSERRDAEGMSAEGSEMVSGSGGPTMTEGGMMPGGSEMENQKQPLQEDPGVEPSIEEQGENLKERLEER